MKRLFSRKSGFSLIEIIIAFMVFAIMATMVARVLNLTINRRNENAKYEEYIQDQNKTIIATGKNTSFGSADGQISLKFKDKGGNLRSDLELLLNYEMKAADGTAGDPSGLNYFTGELDYDAQLGAAAGPGGEVDPEAGGGSQMARFDTRITGTKGIDSIRVMCSPANTEYTEYNVTVIVNDSGVDSSIKSHSQVTIFFGENTTGGKMAEIISLNDGDTTTELLKYCKMAGTSGVNIHCPSDSGFNGALRTFKIKLKEPIMNIGFGSNATGNMYTMYPGYPNIYGAYELANAGS